MSGEGDLSDDYVARILQINAEKNGPNRYLTAGLESLLGGRSRPRSDAPKPNTRFLRHIVKEADSHNAALKVKEREESRRHIRDLRRQRERDAGRGRRQADQLLAHLGRRPANNGRRDDARSKDEARGEKRTRRRSRSRSRSPQKRARPRLSASPRFDSPKGKLHQKADECHKYSDVPRTFESQSDSDSDPLESVIGPQPPSKVKARGRGAQSNSGVDARFDPKYDPSVDVGRDLDDDGDDWDMALEALQDRAKWRKFGAERLHAAGFTREEVSKWEGGSIKKCNDGSSEQDSRDVKWSKRGESREWDRGKVVDDE